MFLASLFSREHSLQDYNREIWHEEVNVKDDVKVSSKWRGMSIFGRITLFTRHFHVVFDVHVLMLNLPNIAQWGTIEIINNTRGGIAFENISREKERDNGGQIQVRMLWKYGTLSSIFGWQCSFHCLKHPELEFAPH